MSASKKIQIVLDNEIVLSRTLEKRTLNRVMVGNTSQNTSEVFLVLVTFLESTNDCA